MKDDEFEAAGKTHHRSNYRVFDAIKVGKKLADDRHVQSTRITSDHAQANKSLKTDESLKNIKTLDTVKSEALESKAFLKSTFINSNEGAQISIATIQQQNKGDKKSRSEIDSTKTTFKDISIQKKSSIGKTFTFSAIISPDIKIEVN